MCADIASLFPDIEHKFAGSHLKHLENMHYIHDNGSIYGRPEKRKEAQRYHFPDWVTNNLMPPDDVYELASRKPPGQTLSKGAAKRGLVNVPPFRYQV